MRSLFLLLVGSLALTACSDTAASPEGEAPGGGGVSATEGAKGGRDGGGNEPGSSGDEDPQGTGVGLSAQYPGDEGIGSDPSVLFHSGFESDFAGWSWYTKDPTLLGVDSEPGLANGGTKYLRASVSRTQLAAKPHISAQAQFDFPVRVPLVYWRFYARFVGNSATPHHWVRLGAGTPGFVSDGLANTKPRGDEGFWFDLDPNDAGIFKFYVYWHEMRSGRCNDGSTTSGCEGDQGFTYFYGNNFSPAGQTAFPRDKWFCIEIRTKANTVGQKDGELAFYIDDVLVGEYKTGTPRGRWLRDNFYSWGKYFVDEGPFEGFDFRTSDDVLIKRITLDAYYEKGSLDDRIAGGLEVPETQQILYDDVVVATTRIGCKT